jgi:integrase
MKGLLKDLDGDRKRWLCRVYLGMDGLGKRHYTSKTVRGTKADAQKELNLLLAEAQKQENVRPNRLTVEVFYPDWLASKKKISDNTRSQYEERVTADILPYFGKTMLKDITPQLVERWVTWMQRERAVSPRTIRYSATVLGMMMRTAFRWQLIPAIPTLGLELPEDPHTEMAVLTPDQMRAVLSASLGTYWHPFWSLLLTGGLRPQEALALDVSDLDGTRVSISKAVTVNEKDVAVVGPTKTKKSRRTVALPAETIAALHAHRREQRILGGLLFRNRDGGLWDMSKVRKAWKKACKAAEVPEVRLYDARHSHATALLALGANLKVVSERLGHASVKLTGDVYAHVLPEMDDRVAELMGTIIAKPVPAPEAVQATSAGR